MNEIKAVVFDWAGTMIDFGSFAPMGVFVETFAEFGVDVTIAEARAPMGMPKRAHIQEMLEAPRIAEAWQVKHGAPPTESDIDRLYDVFVPMNERVVAKYADLVPGAKDTIEYLRAHNIKIGSTTGYTRSIMTHVLPVVAEQGYEPDNLVCSDDVIEGRPGPLGMYKCFVDLGVYPPSSVIKVDDTAPGIAEGVAAGCITVGVTLSGNTVGKTVEELALLPEVDIDALRETAAEELIRAGADHVLNTVADLPALIESLAKTNRAA